MRSTTEALKSLETADGRYWIGVVSASHVNVAVEGGFAQLCHGKSAMLRQMSQGDWMIYYSPRTEISTGKPLQAFTAIGQIIDDRVYQYQMSESFVPFRRDLRYLPCREVKIATLLDQLSFTRGNRNWGFPFRKGHCEIGAEDFMMIASAMLENDSQSLLDTRLNETLLSGGSPRQL